MFEGEEEEADGVVEVGGRGGEVGYVGFGYGVGG